MTEKRGQGTAANKVTTFVWDKQNQLTGMTQTGTDAITASFSYDQFGRRVNKNISANGQSNDVNYVFDGDQAVGEQSNGTTTSQLTGIAIDEHIARYSGADQLTYLTDALGSIIAQTKADQTLQNKYGYSPYGQVAKDGDDKGNPHQYTGRENDNTGLLYYRARYYMPTCGRFINEDPIGTAGGANIYGYVGGNPVNATDPSGLDFTNNSPCSIFVKPEFEATAVEVLPGGSYDQRIDGFAIPGAMPGKVHKVIDRTNVTLDKNFNIDLSFMLGIPAGLANSFRGGWRGEIWAKSLTMPNPDSGKEEQPSIIPDTGWLALIEASKRDPKCK